MSPQSFKILLTADFFDDQGQTQFADIGLSEFANHSHIDHTPFAEHLPEISADQIGNAQGVLVMSPKVTHNTLANPDNLLVVSRFGVGYDTINVDACTNADVVLLITMGAVDRPVAEATVGWMIALTHHFRTKDQLVRTGKWDHRTQYNGCELRDRTLGIVGLGGIGAAVVRLLQGFGMCPPIAYDPFCDPVVAESLGVRLVELDELLETADFVSIHCPLTDGTRNLIGAEQLALMKSDAYLLNTARGGIVNEDALFAALQNRAIAGAALDCFVGEPVTTPHRFGELDNTLLAPHSIAWTDELFRDIGKMACRGMIDLSLGKIPGGVVNKAVFEKDTFRKKWHRLTGIEPQLPT
jgi:phosphoglycerate dehydrogenase-like enzyme